MTSLETFLNILTLVKTLSQEYIERLILILTEEGFNDVNTLTEYMERERFADGRFCPCCGATHIVRNGHRKSDNVQRYLCRDCGKSFVASANSITRGTRKDLKTWEKYIECMMNGMSVRDTADVCGIHRNTAFVWRHKILDTLQGMHERVLLDGIVEADETFFPVSYKGNHKNSKTFVMPRKAHHRGNDHDYVVEVQEDGTKMLVMVDNKRGQSDNQVCVPCAVNRKGQSIARVGKLGKVSNKCIEKALGRQILSKSVLCTDKEKSYRKFSKEHDYTLVQLESGKSKNGIYNIQHINNYHSRLKVFMYRFRGVSTKYLNNYLVWNNLVNYAKETYKEKLIIFENYVMVANANIKCRELSNRPSLPLLA